MVTGYGVRAHPEARTHSANTSEHPGGRKGEKAGVMWSTRVYKSWIWPGPEGKGSYKHLSTFLAHGHSVSEKELFIRDRGHKVT